MTDVDGRLRDELERLAPLDDVGRDWNEVLRRLEPPHRSRTRRGGAWALVLAAAVVVAGGLSVSPVGGAVARTGGAVARTVSGFSAWLRGEPGEPVSDEEQREFEAESRSWNAFPETPQLRRLLGEDVGGTRYELFGYRIGESLCLRLVARGSEGEPATSCAPLRDLSTTSAPALVLLADHPFGTRPLPPDALPGEYPRVRASATFGIVADGVDEVELEGDDGRHEALVGSNAFLYVAPDPPVGARVRKAFARDVAGAREPVPLVAAPSGLTDFQVAENGEPGGPLMPQRFVGRTTIGWLERRELRGQSLEEAAPGRAGGANDPGLVFARVLRPDPNSFARVEVRLVDWSASAPTPTPHGLTLCWGGLPTTPGSRGGCFPFEGFFEPAYVVRAALGTSGGGQYATVVGLAGDVVGRIELFLATGERLAVPFADNAFRVEVARTKLPVRVVAYDRAGAVVATRELGEPAGRRAAGREHVVLTVKGRDATAVLRVRPSTDGGRCWRVSYSDGRETGGCPPKSRQPILDVAVTRGGRDLFLAIPVRAEVNRVVIEWFFRDDARAGEVELRPVDGFVVHPLKTDAKDVSLVIHALARDGRRLSSRRIHDRGR